MNDIPISKDRFRRAILCSLSLLGQGRPELRCGTGTVRCLDSAVTLACLLILSTPKITFFSDRTSLARPSAFIRLVSFKRRPRYHTAVVRQQLFSENFTILFICNHLNKIQPHFFFVFPFSSKFHPSPLPHNRPIRHPKNPNSATSPPKHRMHQLSSKCIGNC